MQQKPNANEEQDILNKKSWEVEEKERSPYRVDMLE